MNACQVLTLSQAFVWILYLIIQLRKKIENSHMILHQYPMIVLIEQLHHTGDFILTKTMPFFDSPDQLIL